MFPSVAATTSLHPTIAPLSSPPYPLPAPNHPRAIFAPTSSPYFCTPPALAPPPRRHPHPPDGSAASTSRAAPRRSQPTMLRAGLSRISSLSPSYILGSGDVSAEARERAMSKERSLESGDAFEVSSTRQFDFGRLVAAFEAVTFPAVAPGSRTRSGRPHAGKLPHLAPFLTAMDEVLLLFNHLGSAFAFVRRDITAKTAILRAYGAEAPDKFADLAAAIRAEIADGTVDAKPPPSAARTILRLMWALKFIDCLLAYLREATAPRSGMPIEERTLRAAVADAYDQALAEHHSWALRRTVRAALALLPTKEVFMDKVCPEKRLWQGYLARLARSMTPMRETMYRFYEEHALLNLS